MTEVVELVLLTIPECFVYKVPPLRTASGHRAEDWNLENPLFTGCLKIFQSNDKLRLAIYCFKEKSNTSLASDNIILFGECHIEVKPGENIVGFVDCVIDSSRYYVVRIKDFNSTRTTLIGIGFRDRAPAFDFKNCLNDYVKYIDRMALATKLSSSRCESDISLTNDGDESSMLNNSNSNNVKWISIPPLKEGEKIVINTHSKNSKNKKTASDSCNGLLLVKPPPPGSIVHFKGSSSEDNYDGINNESYKIVNNIINSSSMLFNDVYMDATDKYYNNDKDATDSEEWGEFSSSATL